MDDKQPPSLLRKRAAPFDISGFFAEPPVQKKEGPLCPYISTVKRHLLDFDFQKVCSVTLSNQNVYACLVCGKYFQGRGKKTHAHLHALEALHYLFINLHDQKIYCLPENYEVTEASLNDIKFNLRPRYTPEQVATFDSQVIRSRGLDGAQFLAGCVGLNDLKKTDSMNSVLQCLSRVSQLRDYFLLRKDSAAIGGEPRELLVEKFSELVKKMWNPRNFKGHVSPHEALQAVAVASDKKFRIDKQADPMGFMAWLLHTLHLGLVELRHSKLKEAAAAAGAGAGAGAGKRSARVKMDRIHDYKTIITRCFQGELEVAKYPASPDAKAKKQKFLYLTADLPPPSIFQESADKKNIIPQVDIMEVLKKFKHKHLSQRPNSTERVSYRLTKLPEYLVLHLKRFNKNNFFLEKNPTIVTFPTKGLDLSSLLDEDTRELEGRATYRLVGNVLHEGKPEAGSYKAQAVHRAEGGWYELQELHVSGIEEEFVSFSEVLVQVYAREHEGPEREEARKEEE